MQIYHYSPVTGNYLGSGPADPDPLAEGEFLVPAYATTVAPPEAIAGHARAWRGTQWVQEATPAPEAAQTEAPAESVTEATERRAAEARARRNRLLRDSDFRVLPDLVASMQPQTLIELYAYRAALRGIPQQPEFPDAITWPALPN